MGDAVPTSGGGGALVAPPRCRVIVALLAPNGAAQPVQLVIQANEIVLENSDGKPVQKFPLSRVHKWVSANKRTKNPGPADCLDLQMMFQDGSRELRLKCNSEKTVADISKALKDHATYAYALQGNKSPSDPNAGKAKPPPPKTTPSSHEPGMQERMAKLALAGKTSPTSASVEDIGKVAQTASSKGGEKGSDFVDPREKRVAELQQQEQAKPLTEAQKLAQGMGGEKGLEKELAERIADKAVESALARAVEAEGRANRTEKARAEAQASLEAQAKELKETQIRHKEAEAKVALLQSEVERAVQFATRMREALSQRDERMIKFQQRVDEEIKRRKVAEGLLRQNGLIQLLPDRGSPAPASPPPPLPALQTPASQAPAMPSPSQGTPPMHQMPAVSGGTQIPPPAQMHPPQMHSHQPDGPMQMYNNPQHPQVLSSSPGTQLPPAPHHAQQSAMEFQQGNLAHQHQQHPQFQFPPPGPEASYMNAANMSELMMGDVRRMQQAQMMANGFAFHTPHPGMAQLGMHGGYGMAPYNGMRQQSFSSPAAPANS
ncbi:hypothetical protein CYMTET_3350 [Cymbomonas tetramitiformis]|uniref:Uncharacterized protein n=1 Tax=Cymbomonas tetramitiformis TaxID=36881 RepID=A0AAE0H3F2_9CHLO|nr:hypothetical protein CYMTET_3350 [Cymbomonas tetramitiformis]